MKPKRLLILVPFILLFGSPWVTRLTYENLKLALPLWNDNFRTFLSVILPTFTAIFGYLWIMERGGFD